MSCSRRTLLRGCAAALLPLLIPAHANAIGAAAVGSSYRFDNAEVMVHKFLELHFAGSREFSGAGLENKRRFLTPRFRSTLYKFLTERARAREQSSSPPMVLDPFTSSMGATDYSVGKAKVRSERAWVPVTFTDGTNRWTTTYLLRSDQERGDDRWRLDDIEDVRGMLLSKVLKEDKP